MLRIVDLYEHENGDAEESIFLVELGKKLYTTFDNFEIIPLFFNRSNGIKYIFKKILEMVFEFAARRDRKIRRERRSSDNNN